MTQSDQSASAFTCLRCGMTSHNPTDVREGYCGNCHDWTRNVRAGWWPGSDAAFDDKEVSDAGS